MEHVESRYGRFQEPGGTYEGCPGSGRVNVAEKESRNCHNIEMPASEDWGHSFYKILVMIIANRALNIF